MVLTILYYNTRIKSRNSNKNSYTNELKYSTLTIEMTIRIYIIQPCNMMISVLAHGKFIHKGTKGCEIIFYRF